MFNLLMQLFGSSSEENSKVSWNEFSEDTLPDLVKASYSKVQVIYKHSTRCATSYLALKNLQLLTKEEQEKADYYIVDVLRQRELSQRIAEELEVRHESPQVILLRDGNVEWHGSHYEVKAQNISMYL